jgi:hypothetical protein
LGDVMVREGADAAGQSIFEIWRVPESGSRQDNRRNQSDQGADHTDPPDRTP